MSTLVRNDTDSVKIRRDRVTLMTSGAGVAAFGCWSYIRIIMELLLSPPDPDIGSIADMLGIVGEIIIYIFILVVIMPDILLRFRVAHCARREARGQGKNMSKYRFSTIVLLIFQLVSVYLTIDVMIDNFEISIRKLVSLFVELTSLFVLVELMIVRFDLRRRLARADMEAEDNAA